MGYDNTKQVVVSKVVSDKPNAPALSVNFEINGQKYRAGLWPWTRKDGTPVNDKNGNALYKGDWEEDNYTAQAQQQGMDQAKAQMKDDLPKNDYGDFNDSIPF